MICKKEIITKYIHIWIFKKYKKTMVKHSPFNNDITDNQAFSWCSTILRNSKNSFKRVYGM